MKEAVIVSAVRTPGGKAPRGTLSDTSPVYLGKLVIEEALRRVPSIKPDMIDDVIMGCAITEQLNGLNIARLSSMYAGLPESVPAVTINRFCSSGSQAIGFAAEAIISGRCDVVIAGGIESMSLINPMGGLPRPEVAFVEDPYLGQLYATNGQTAENVANRYGVSRESQDEFAFNSHRKCAQALKEGKFKNEYVPVPVTTSKLDKNNKVVSTQILYDYEEGVRADITMEVLAKLRPVFVPGGTVTAGNSSQTTDGASAAVVISREKADELGIKARLKYVGCAVAGCRPDEFGIAPIYAIPKALKRYGLKLEDIGLIELNEAFASQAVFCVRELGIDPNIVNVNGGAIAMGHPLGATGGKLTATLMYEMERRNVKYGMVSMCVGGGQGLAMIFELC